MFGSQISQRLRDLRKHQRIKQSVVAESLGLCVSAVSRLERGIRGLRVEQLMDWADALGHRVEIVFFEPTTPDQQLSEEHTLVLAAVARALPHLPSPALEALLHEMRLWTHDASPSIELPIDLDQDTSQ